MPDPTTTNRAFTIPNNGADVGTWDSPVNGNMNLLDTMLGGVATISLSSANVTLSASAYQCGVVRFTGALANTVVVTFPAVSAWWTVQNDMTGVLNSAVKLTCGGGRQICAPPGGYDIYGDGSNMNYRNLPPVGSYLQLATNNSAVAWISNCSVPPYLYCNGASFSNVTYPALAAYLGGTTLPDARGRLNYNLNDGSGRIGTYLPDSFLGAGGNEGTTLVTSNLPATSYNFSNTGNSFVTSVGQNVSGYTNGGKNALASVSVGGPSAPAGTIGPLGSATQFSNAPPAFCGGLTFIRAA